MIDRGFAPTASSGDGPPLLIRNLHFRAAEPGWITPRHAHRIPQWYWCSYGSMDIEIDGVIHALRAEESVLVRPEAVREIRVASRAAGYLVTIFEAAPVIGLHTCYHRVLTLPGEARDDAHALVAEVRRPGGADSRVLASALVTRVVIALVRSVRSGSEPVLGPLNAETHTRIVNQVETFMIRNLPHALRRADIAAAVNLSEPHLARIFKIATGRSVMDRLVELRMKQAQLLLLESTMSVTQVARAVGITSFSYFSKVFKEAAGVTPSYFRKASVRTPT